MNNVLNIDLVYNITVQSKPNRKRGCLTTFFFVLLLVVVVAVTNLCNVPEMTLTPSTRIKNFDDFDAVKSYPQALHRRVFSVSGTVAWSSYFYFGGCYRIEDTTGESLYVFTNRIPYPKETSIDQQILYLEVIGLLDTWHFYILKEVKVTKTR